MSWHNLILIREPQGYIDREQNKPSPTFLNANSSRKKRMPLLNGAPFEFAPVPPEDQAKPDTIVFYIPFTGEIFLTHEEYYERMMLYKQRSWTCIETKKSGLTFLEALQCEQKASRKVDPKFPGVWIKPCLEMIHLSVLPLSELVDTIYGYFRGTRFVTEHVFVDVPSAGTERSVERAVITEKLPNTVPLTLEKNLADKRQIQREAREALEDNSRVPEDNFHYRVSIVSKPKEYIIGPTQMRRPRQMLSKITFRNYIKEVARKDKQIGSPWIVKANLVQKYGLRQDIPDPASYKKVKKPRPMDLSENPIEDTELMVKPFIRKPDNENEAFKERPEPSYEFGSISESRVLPLIKAFNFLAINGAPLQLYPFQFDSFIQCLAHNSPTQSEIICESFGSLLAVACQEYQSRMDPNLANLNPHYVGLPHADENGYYSTNGKENEVMTTIMNIYKGFSIHEKVAVDQWFKWRPGQWGGLSTKKSKFPTLEHIKAWPVALFGLVKDCWPSSPENLFKWVILEKLLAPPPFEVEEEDMMQIDEPLDEEQSKSVQENEGIGNTNCEDVDELADSEMLESSQNKIPSDIDELATDNDVSPIKAAPKQKTPKLKSKKRPKSKKKLEQGMLFEDLCHRMELGFWNLTADEKVDLIDFIIDEFVLDSKALTAFRDAALEKFTDLKKEQREIARHRKAIAQSIQDISKTIEGGTAISSVPLFDAPIDVGDTDGSDNEFDDLKPKRNTRLSKARKVAQAKVAVEPANTEVAPVVQLTEEQLLKEEEKRLLLLKDLQYKRRNNVIEFELKSASASNRLKPLGRDRFCNRYWFFDANHGSLPIEAVTKIDQDGTLESKPDPEIPYNYSTGVLFIEVFGFQQDPSIKDPASEPRLGNKDGRWGYFSRVDQYEQLNEWLDRRGTRESTLQHNLEHYKDYIIASMKKRNEDLLGELQKAEDQRTLRSGLSMAGLMDDKFGYENWWAVL